MWTGHQRSTPDTVRMRRVACHIHALMLVAVLGLGSAFVSGCPDVESGRSASEQWITARPSAQAHPPVLESCVAAKGSGYGVDVIEKQRALIREAN